MEKFFKKLQITDDKLKIDVELVHKWLNQTYWAKNRALEIVKRSLENSLCFAVIDHADSRNLKQIAFARAVTDYATYAIVLDVFVEPTYRSQGIGQELMKFVINHPKICHTKRTLSTKDAEKFYEKLGFKIYDDMKTLYIN